MHLHLRQTASANEWWWCRSEALHDISRSLNTTFVAIVDHFLPAQELQNLCSEVSAAYTTGKLSEHGKIGGGTSGSDLAEALLDESIRGDLFGFFEGKSASDDAALKAGWGQGRALTRTLDKMNTLVCELRDGEDPSTGSNTALTPELQSVSTRSRAMVTCYPGNQKAYTKHCDNAMGNGRKLTTILYLNPNWGGEDGGELVIYPSHKNVDLCNRIYGAGAGAVGVNVRSGNKAAVAISPVLNRLVMFWSDMRCPHEVLPTNRERFALTLWFIDAAERARSMEQRRLATAQTLNSRVAAAGTSQYTKDTCVSNDCGIEGTGLDIITTAAVSPSVAPAPVVLSDIPTAAQPNFICGGGGGGVGGSCGTWNAGQKVIVYQVRFADHSQVATTVVDIVEHATLLVHCTQQSYDDICAVLVLPNGYVVEEENTTAKYSKKKGVLTICIQCVHDTN